MIALSLVQKSPARRSGRAHRPANLAETSVNESEDDLVDDSEASSGGSDADEEASDGKQQSEDKASDDTSDVDVTGDDEPPARCEVMSS